MNRTLVSARDGWLGARENLVPGLVIIFFAALLVSAYYSFASLRDALEGLQSLRNSWGLAFSMLTSAIGAGVFEGSFTYGKRYLARPEVLALDPFHLPLSTRPRKFTKLKGIPGAVRDARPDA